MPEQAHLTLTIDAKGDCTVEILEGLDATAAAEAIGKASNMVRTVCRDMAEHIEASFGSQTANSFFAIVQKFDRMQGELAGKIALRDARKGG